MVVQKLFEFLNNKTEQSWTIVEVISSDHFE